MQCKTANVNSNGLRRWYYFHMAISLVYIIRLREKKTKLCNHNPATAVHSVRGSLLQFPRYYHNDIVSIDIPNS